MTTAVKSMQDWFKKKKKKKIEEASTVSNSSFSLLASSATTQNSSLQFQSLNTHMTADTVNTILTDYDLCASFIADNESDSHVIN